MSEETTDSLETDQEQPAESASSPATPAAPPPEASAAKVEVNQEQWEAMTKRMQQVTQELAQLKRNKDGELTAVQEAKRAEAHAAGERILAEVSALAQSGEAGEVGGKLASAVQELQRRQKDLEAENNTLRSRVQSLPDKTNDQIWAEQKAKYPGVDVEKLFAKSEADAAKSLTVQRAQTRLKAGKIDQETFDEIVEAAINDIYMPAAKAASAALRPPTAAPPPPKTPGGKRSALISGEPAPTVEHDDLYSLGERVTADIMKAEGRGR